MRKTPARRRPSSTTKGNDQRSIRALIARWARSVRERDLEGIRSNHHRDILMFDVPPPFQVRGIEDYMRTWDTFLSWAGDSRVFDFEDIEITADTRVAFATATGHCEGSGPDGRKQSLKFRLTMGLRRIKGQWTITHEHHSIPAAT